ncbi:rhodanese-like domain-containing protein [Anaerolineales bacterium HSG24]|nr:rhodanese-like domain-containing protein [Anaerolineales bacterium HSG24]
MNNLTKIYFIAILVLITNALSMPVLAEGPPADLDVLRQAVADYFPYEDRQYRMSSDDLYAILHDGDQTNDPFVLSVQTSKQYELGHIPNSINIPWDEITDVAQLQTQIPKDKLVVVYCNHDVHSAQISAILNLLGYNTLDLFYGLEGWTQNKVAIPDHFDPDCPCTQEGGYLLDTQAYTVEPTNQFPELDVSGSTTEEIIIAAANDYLASERDTYSTIEPCDLNDILIDDDSDNNPFVLSLQWPEGYTKGHVPTAVNIPRWELFASAENLSKLPTDQPIVICCYLGFTSSQVVAILNMMGYDAKVALHGLCGWTTDSEITHFDITDPQNWRDYPIEGTAVNAVYEETTAETAIEETTEESVTEESVAEETVEESATEEPSQLATDSSCQQIYMVQYSDMLSEIAEKYLDDIMAYNKIVEATNKMHATDDSFANITNPDLIEINWKLCVP